jgi:hypothetical protein
MNRELREESAMRIVKPGTGRLRRSLLHRANLYAPWRERAAQTLLLAGFAGLATAAAAGWAAALVGLNTAAASWTVGAVVIVGSVAWGLRYVRSIETDIELVGGDSTAALRQAVTALERIRAAAEQLQGAEAGWWTGQLTTVAEPQLWQAVALERHIRDLHHELNEVKTLGSAAARRRLGSMLTSRRTELAEQQQGIAAALDEMADAAEEHVVFATEAELLLRVLPPTDTAAAEELTKRVRAATAGIREVLAAAGSAGPDTGKENPGPTRRRAVDR